MRFDKIISFNLSFLDILNFSAKKLARARPLGVLLDIISAPKLRF